MTPERYQRITEVLNRRQPDLTVLLENVHKPHNLSAILRTCDAVGVAEVHAVTRDEEFRVHLTTASGSDKWVDGYAYGSIGDAAGHLGKRGFRIVAAHLSDAAVDFRSADFRQPVAVLLGTEKFGVSKEAMELADEEIFVPMMGMVPSLNVSVAAAVILYEAQRQRAAAGLYDRNRLDPDHYRDTVFRWGYPQLTAYYERRGEPFPALDDSGGIIEPVAPERHDNAR